MTGKRYLGGFLGTRAELEAYVREKIVDWVDNVKVLSRAAKRYPQSAYCVFTKSLQAEWIYIQRILPGIGHLFAPLEEAIADVFIPALLGTVTIDPSDRSLYRDIFALPVRKCGLAIMDPTKTADAAFKASTVMTGYMVSCKRDRSKPFELATHNKVMTETRKALELERDIKYDVVLEELLMRVSADAKRQIEAQDRTGSWLNCFPFARLGMTLSAQEFRTGISMRYDLPLADLPQFCDGCGKKYTRRHAFSCHCGGLLTHAHDDVAAETICLMQKATCNSDVHAEPRINPGRRRDTPELPLSKARAQTVTPIGPSEVESDEKNAHWTDDEKRADIYVRNFYSPGRPALFDIRMFDHNQASYRKKPIATVLANHEREKRRKYAQEAAEQRKDFSPFVVTRDGIIGRAAENTMRRIASTLAGRWDMHYSRTSYFVRSRISIAILRSTNHALYGARIPFRPKHYAPQWTDNAAIDCYWSNARTL